MSRIKNIRPYIFLFIIFFMWNLLIFPLDVNEIVNYGFSHSIYSGLIPYIDFNLTTTPLYWIFMSAPFHIFGSNILVFHLTHIILLLANCYLLFKYFKNRAWIMILLFFLPLPNLIPDYTWLLLFLYLNLIYLENEEKRDFLIGILLGLCILTKQDVGLFLLLPSILYITKPIKLLKRTAGVIIPVIMFLVYLMFTGSTSNFLYLCFGNLDLSNFFSVFGIVTIALIIVTINIIKRNPKDIENYYSLAFYSIMIPYFDYSHLSFCLVAFLITFFLNRTEKVSEKFSYTLFSTVFIICITVVGAMMFFQKNTYPNTINHFEYRMIPKKDVYDTEALSGYLDQHRTDKFIFLNSNGYYIKLVNDMPITSLDLLRKENWGINGKKRILNIVKANKNVFYVINRNELDKTGEYNSSAIEYVRKNGRKIQTVGTYDIYILK